MARKSSSLKYVVVGILVAVLIISFARCVVVSENRKAVEVVEGFYKFEQQGDFSSSWNLFHSALKKKFTKGHYIQDRAHVFMNHFGVETFTFTVGKPEKLNQWKMSPEGPGLEDVYKITVTQTYKGKYGNFDLIQSVFAVEEKGEWKILWDYNQ